jgi:phage terminase large subunit
MEVKFPKVFEPFIKSPRRYNLLRGGRGSGKSWTVADIFLIWGMTSRKRFLCTREIQKSIKESVHQLLDDKIRAKKLPYIVTRDSIRCTLTGSEFIFHGLQDITSQNIKSMEGISACWIEEAHTATKKSLDLLIPTIRQENSFLVFTYNPDEEDDPISNMFDENDPDVLFITANYYDNPYCPDTLIKEAERSKAKAEKTGDWSDYNHIWLGHPISRTAKIFKNYRVEEFDYQPFDNIREGMDWGFADDPFAWVKLHLDKKRGILYVIDELYLYGHSNHQAFDKVKEVSGNISITADCSEPKSINEARNYGLCVNGAKKGQGSVEHGIKYIQSLEVVIHPRCVNTLTEFKKYSYKEDKNGNVLPQPVDKFNHIIDSMRYALENDSDGGGGIGISFF